MVGSDFAAADGLESVGVELVLGTFPEELEMLQTDEEFTRYAKFVDVCSR